jgi:hypothetical protein
MPLFLTRDRRAWLLSDRFQEAVLSALGRNVALLNGNNFLHSGILTAFFVRRITPFAPNHETNIAGTE